MRPSVENEEDALIYIYARILSCFISSSFLDWETNLGKFLEDYEDLILDGFILYLRKEPVYLSPSIQFCLAECVCVPFVNSIYRHLGFTPVTFEPPFNPYLLFYNLVPYPLNWLQLSAYSARSPLFQRLRT